MHTSEFDGQVRDTLWMHGKHQTQGLTNCLTDLQAAISLLPMPSL